MTTTSITILNNGPDNISVDVIDSDGQLRAGARRVLTPGQFLAQLYVYPGQGIAVAEVKGAAPAGNFANGPSDGPAPVPDVSSPMQVLMRQWPDLTEPQINAKVQAMTAWEFDALPPFVREKMNERMDYFQRVDSLFKRPAWYTRTVADPAKPVKPSA